MAWNDSAPTPDELKKILSVSPDDLNGMLNGRYSDTGRVAGSPGERMDSMFGGPSRAAIQSMQQGNFSGAPAAAWNKFNTDPAVNPAPSGEDLMRNAGVTNPYAAKGLGFLANVASDPVTLASFGAGKLPGMAGEIYDASKMFGKKNPPGARKALTEAMALEKDAPALVNTTTPTGNLVDVNAPQEMANPGKEPIGSKFFPPFPEAVEPVRGKGAFWNDPNDQRFTDDAKDVMNNLDARFPKGKETKAFRKQLSDAQDGPDHQPYVGKEVSGFDSHTLPNFAAKPIGVIGNDTINVPSTSNTSNPDPFPWMDSKYGSGKQLLAKHQSLDMPADIHTSSDLIGRDDYISKIPDDSTVNMHVLTPDDTLNRIIFPGNPSNKRLMDAVARLKEAGIKTNVVRPTVEDVLGAVKNGEQGFSDQTGVENPKEYLQKMGLQTDAERYPPLTPVKAQMGAVSPSIPRSPQSTSGSWDSTPPTKEEMDQINGVAPAQTQAAAPAPVAQAQSPRDIIGNADDIAKTIGGPNSSLQGTADAVTGMLGNYGPQIKGKAWQIASGEGLANNEDYVKRRDAIIADEKARAEQYPASDIIGKGLGFVAPAAVTGGGSVTGSLGNMAAKSAVAGGVIGGLSNPGDNPGVVDTTQLGPRAKNTAVGMAVGGALPYAAAGAGKAFDWLAPKAISTFLGPSEEATRARFADPDRIKNAPSIETIKNNIDDSMQGLFSAVDNAQVSKDGAQRQLGIIEDEIRKATGDAKFSFNLTKQSTNDALKEAQDQVKQAFDAKTSALSEQAKPPQLETQIKDAIGTLKDQVQAGSQASYDALDHDTGTYSVRNAGKLLRSMADDMNIKGVPTKGENMDPGLVAQGYAGQAAGSASVPGVTPQSPAATAESRGVQAQLRNWAGILEETPEQVPARELKKILQQIDNSESAQYGQPGFDGRVSRAYKTVRATINGVLRENNPEFAKIMDDVAPKTDLLEHAINRFGNTPDNPNLATSRLSNIGGRTGELDRALLANLGDQTGHDFITPINEHIEAKAQLADPDAIRSAIPQSQDVAELQAQQRNQGRYEAPLEYVNRSVNMSALPEEKASATKNLADSESRLSSAKSAVEPFGNLGPKSTQNVINNLMKAPDKESIEYRKQIEGLSGLTGKDFSSNIEDRRLANQFDGSYMNGSRNTNIGRGIGGAIGAWTTKSLEGAAIAGGLGGMAGGVVDRNGRAMAGTAIDIASAASKTKAGQALLQIPAYASIAKNYPAAFAGLVHAVAGDIDSQQNGGPVKTPLKGAAKWADDGHNALLVHAQDPADREMLTSQKPALMADPKARDLMTKASDLKPGTKAMQNVFDKLKATQTTEDEK